MTSDQIVGLIGAFVQFHTRAAGDDFGIPIELAPGARARVIGLALHNESLAFVLADSSEHEPYTVPLEFLASASIVGTA